MMPLSRLDGLPMRPPVNASPRPSRVTDAAHREILEQLVVDKRDPLAFFLSVLRSDNAPFEERKAAAKEALPYCSPKLASIESRGGGKSHEDRLAGLHSLMKEDE